MPEIENVARPPEMLIFNPTVEQCEAAGLEVKTEDMTLYTTDVDGNRRERIVTKKIPSAVRLLPGEIKDVQASFLEIPKVKRAIERGKLRKATVRVEPRKPRRRAESRSKAGSVPSGDQD